MAYIPTVWVDHVNSGNCYNISNNDDGTKEITYAGQVLQQGTPMSAENFNHMEQGILSASQNAENNQKKIDENANAIDNIGRTAKSDGIRITALEQKTSDMYSKSEVFEIIVQKIAEIVAGAPEDFDTLKEMSDWITNHADSAADMNTAITKNSKDISLLEEKTYSAESDASLNKSTLGYQIKNLFDVFSVNWYQPSKTTVAEDGTVTTTVTSDPRQFIYSNSDAFVTLGAGTYKIIVNTTDFVSGTYAQINGRDSDNNSIFLLPTSSAGIHKTTFTLTERTTIGIILKTYSQTFTLMICDGDFEDESYVPYTNTSVDERLRKFESQPLLYSSTSTEESPLMVNVKGLFRNYSVVICQMYTSNYTDKFNLTLPLKYIKSIGTGSYYSAESQLLFEYVDDDNLCIRTGMGQSNPTMSGVKIIALY